MLHYFKFRQELLDPAPARDVYVKRGKGRGWPEECPPIRAANAFGFDVLANFDLTFVRVDAVDLGYELLVCHACARYLKERRGDEMLAPMIERALTVDLDAAAERRGLRI